MATSLNERSVLIQHGPGVVVDIDVDPRGRWVALTRSVDGALQVQGAHFAAFAAPKEMQLPLLRSLPGDRLLIVNQRSANRLPNGHVLSESGETLCELDAGDGIADVVVLASCFAVTYFDEGVFGSSATAYEGVAFFDFSGRYIWGYRTALGDRAVDIADCYAACRAGDDILMFCPYTDFPLVELDVAARAQRVTALPEALHGAGALSRAGHHVLFFSPRNSRGAVLQWAPGEAIATLGRSTRRLRGLAGGRFLSSDEHGFTVISPEPFDG